MTLKTLLFGSTAGLMVVTGAQAADLPAAEPVEYVRVCDAFGTGFFYIPGTDTCLKIDGYARYEMHWVSDSDIYEYDPSEGRTNDSDAYGHSESFNNFTTRTRGEVRFDARTMTDLGLLRSYVALRGTIGPTNSGSYSDGFNVDKVWLSLANDAGTLTAGHHLSFYDFFGGKAMNTRIGGDDPTVSTNLLAYTFGVGNGLDLAREVGHVGDGIGSLRVELRIAGDRDPKTAERSDERDQLVGVLKRTARVRVVGRCIASERDDVPYTDRAVRAELSLEFLACRTDTRKVWRHV
jgi:hypothetical protein